MKLKLHTEIVIDSCHHLEGYNGKCSNLHGHSWLIELWFEGDSIFKDKVGILVDFGIVKDLKNTIDHRNLNEIFNINPTAENMTEYIYDYIKCKINKNIKVKVKVHETVIGKSTWCEGGDFQ